MLKKVLNIPKVKKHTPPLIQAQHVVLVSGEVSSSQDKNQDQKKQAGNIVRYLEKFQNRANFEYSSP